MDVKSVRERLKLASRNALAARGIEVRSTHRGMRHTRSAVLAHFRRLGLAPGSIIDVGVGTGTQELYTVFPDARLMLVEPLEEWRGHLEAIARERPAVIAMAAAGATAGEVQIAVHRAPVCSSMLGSRRGDDEQPSRSVAMVRLDDLVSQHAMPGPFVLKVDVEGGELEVMRGAPEVLSESELVLLECSLFELVPGMPLLHEVIAWMNQNGFVVAELYNGHNRLLDGSLAQLDVAFVREDGRFRREHDYATPAQADKLYRSWGF